MMKEGLHLEHGELIYYKHGRPYHAGAVRVDGEIYYISSKGRAVKGPHVVHGEMTNGILKRGTYTFGDDYKLVPGSFIAPRKRKKWSFFKKWKKWVPACCLALVVCLGALLAVNANRIGVDPYQKIPEVTDFDPDQIDVITEKPLVHLPTFDSEVLLCSPAAKQVYENTATVENAVDAGTAYRPFIFEYDFTDAEGFLTITEAEDPTATRVFTLLPKYTSISIDNLKTGTKYLYKVTVNGETYEGEFETERSTRFLSVDGIANVRDIGGYETMDGKTVRQGMVIRGSEMDGLVVPSYFINEEEAAETRETFGFVYDFDLRGGNIYSGVYQSRLGEDVGHYFYGAPQYGEVFNRTYQPALREIFTDLADPSKYPMYLHCSYGADRTGTIVYMLQAVLNMSEEDMLREYQLTGFTTRGYQNSERMDILINGMEAYEGDTLQERIVNFLKNTVGITDEQIQSIRNILLED